MHSLPAVGRNFNHYTYCLPARPQRSGGGNNPLMYTDPSGYEQVSFLDVIDYILNNLGSISSGTTYNFSGGYCTNFNGGLGSYGDNATGSAGGISGGSFWSGWNKFHITITSKFIKVIPGYLKAKGSFFNFKLPSFNWGTLFSSGSSASWNEGRRVGNYSNSSNDPGADIYNFSNFDGDRDSGGGGGSPSWGSILFPRGLRNQSSEVIYVLQNWGEPWKPLKPNKSWYKPFDAVRAHGVIIKVNDLQTFGPFRINITVVDKAHPNDSGFRYDALDMSINQFLNFFYGLFFDKTKETFIPENTPGWE